jgi:hypothetical protein
MALLLATRRRTAANTLESGIRACSDSARRAEQMALAVAMLGNARNTSGTAAEIASRPIKGGGGD